MIKEIKAEKSKLESELKTNLDFEIFFNENEGKDLFPAKTAKVKKIYAEINKKSV